MLSAKGSDIVGSSSHMTAVYKALRVSVYAVDKPEVNLTRRDLVELINVCSSYPECKLTEKNRRLWEGFPPHWG